LKKIKSNKSAAQPKLQCEYVIIKTHLIFHIPSPNQMELKVITRVGNILIKLKDYI